MNAAFAAHLPSSRLGPLLRNALLGLCMAGILALAGCANYRVGYEGLYAPTIQTVYVPVFESDSFRRNMGERLTEAVIKEIQRRTPYQVVSSPMADSVLTGTIVTETKRVLVESPLDEPRVLEINLQVRVTWSDRQGGMLQPERSLPVNDDSLLVGRATPIQVEVGQSIATGHQTTINRLAQQIVSMMEAPW
jgi:hypothetical protein